MPQIRVDSVRVPHPFAGRRQVLLPALPLDLHVLSLPLAFILSQDQTLHCKWIVWNWLMFSNVNFRKINRFIVLFSLGMPIYTGILSCMNRTSSVHAVTFLLSQSFKERSQPALDTADTGELNPNCGLEPRTLFCCLLKNFLPLFYCPFFAKGVQRYSLLVTPQNCFSKLFLKKPILILIISFLFSKKINSVFKFKKNKIKKNWNIFTVLIKFLNFY